MRFLTFDGTWNEHVDKQLRVALSRTGLSGGQVNFDSVALDVSGSPEPDVFVLFGTVALALWRARWRTAKAWGRDNALTNVKHSAIEP